MNLFDSKEVLSFIEEYSKTPEGKEELKKLGVNSRGFVPKYYDKNSVYSFLRQAKREAQVMADILYKHIVEDTVTVGTDADGNSYQRIGLSGFKREDIKISEPIQVEGEYDQYFVRISFDKEALHRDSLIKGDSGISDVIELFVHGYSNAKKSVHGEWHGREIWTKRNRPGNDFMTKAVEEFNRMPEHKHKARAILEDKYDISK